MHQLRMCGTSRRGDLLLDPLSPLLLRRSSSTLSLNSSTVSVKSPACFFFPPTKERKLSLNRNGDVGYVTLRLGIFAAVVLGGLLQHQFAFFCWVRQCLQGTHVLTPILIVRSHLTSKSKSVLYSPYSCPSVLSCDKCAIL